jgi:hypothetical protein
MHRRPGTFTLSKYFFKFMSQILIHMLVLKDVIIAGDRYLYRHIEKKYLIVVNQGSSVDTAIRVQSGRLRNRSSSPRRGKDLLSSS